MSYSVVNDNIHPQDLNSLILNPSVVRLNLISGVTQTANFSVSDSVDTYILDGTTSFTVTLPSALSSAGRLFHFRLSAATGGASSVSVSPNVIPINSTTGSATLFPISTNVGASLSIISNGTNWLVVRRQVPA
jgi:hypothetical protein